MRARVTKKERGLARLLSAAKQMERKPFVKVGVMGGDHPSAKGRPLTNVELATIHEFGAPAAGIPSRPFLRSTFDAKKAEWNRLMARLITKVVAGHLDVVAALELVGQRAAGDVRNRITQGGNFVPNKPATIRRKGSSKPLIDSARLLQSISHQVVTG